MSLKPLRIRMGTCHPRVTRCAYGSGASRGIRPNRAHVLHNMSTAAAWNPTRALRLHFLSLRLCLVLKVLKKVAVLLNCVELRLRRYRGIRLQTPPRDPLRQCIIKEVGFFAVERPVMP